MGNAQKIILFEKIFQEKFLSRMNYEPKGFSVMSTLKSLHRPNEGAEIGLCVKTTIQMIGPELFSSEI